MTELEQTDERTRVWLERWPNEWYAINLFRSSRGLSWIERRAAPRKQAEGTKAAVKKET